MHWINAVAMIILIGSGWKIYNDEVLFGWLHFPDWMIIGVWAQHGLQWHFFAMWMLMINGLCYLVYGFSTGPLPPQAAADLAERDHRRRSRRAAFQASRMTTSRITTPCRSCSMSASSWSSSSR